MWRCWRPIPNVQQRALTPCTTASLTGTHRATRNWKSMEGEYVDYIAWYCRDCLPYPLQYCFVVGWSLRLWGQSGYSCFFSFLFFYVWTDVRMVVRIFVIPPAVTGVLKKVPLNTPLFKLLSTLFHFNKYYIFYIMSMNACLLCDNSDELLQFAHSNWTLLFNKLVFLTLSGCNRMPWRHACPLILKSWPF